MFYEIEHLSADAPHPKPQRQLVDEGKSDQDRDALHASSFEKRPI